MGDLEILSRIFNIAVFTWRPKWWHVIILQDTPTTAPSNEGSFSWIVFFSLYTRLWWDLQSKRASKCQPVQAACSRGVLMSLKYMAFALNVTVNVTAVVAQCTARRVSEAAVPAGHVTATAANMSTCLLVHVCTCMYFCLSFSFVVDVWCPSVQCSLIRIYERANY